jgi:hypothetical protein
MDRFFFIRNYCSYELPDPGQKNPDPAKKVYPDPEQQAASLITYILTLFNGICCALRSYSVSFSHHVLRSLLSLHVIIMQFDLA